ncbi:uncharacterized protein TM35_000013470, partial [Trypanosoma theileri]
MGIQTRPRFCHHAPVKSAGMVESENHTFLVEEVQKNYNSLRSKQKQKKGPADILDANGSYPQKAPSKKKKIIYLLLFFPSPYLFFFLGVPPEVGKNIEFAQKICFSPGAFC